MPVSPWGAEGRVLGARTPTKISEEILQWAGTHKVSGNGNLGDLYISMQNVNSRAMTE